MTPKDMVVQAIEALGHHPLLDEEGFIYIRHWLGTIYFLMPYDGKKFATALLANFADYKESEEDLIMQFCHRMTRDIHMAKVFVDPERRGISASCEFYFTDMESLQDNIQHALVALMRVRLFHPKIYVEITQEKREKENGLTTEGNEQNNR